MIQILFGLRSMLGLDRKNDDFYANLLLIKKITIPITKPIEVSSIFPLIRPPVTRANDKENRATRTNQPLFKNVSFV